MSEAKKWLKSAAHDEEEELVKKAAATSITCTWS